MRPPEPDSSSSDRLARYTPDSRRWRYTLAGIGAVAAPVLFYYTVRLISSTWSGTLPSLLVLVGSVLTLVTAAAVPTLLLAPDGGGRSEAEPDGAVAELKRQYASGKVSEEEFERRLETLIESSSDGERRAAGAAGGEPRQARAGVESEFE